MKKCKQCQSEIDDKAKVCPNCRKKQGMPIWLIIIIVIIGIIFISSIFSGGESNKEEQTGNTKESLTLLDDHTGSMENEWSYNITGTIQNNTDKEYSYVEVEFYAYDSEGNLLDTCSDYISSLEANSKWKFTANCYLENSNANKIASYKLKEITNW